MLSSRLSQVARRSARSLEGVHLQEVPLAPLNIEEGGGRGEDKGGFEPGHRGICTGSKLRRGEEGGGQG